MYKELDYLRLIGSRAFNDYAWLHDFAIGSLKSSATIGLFIYFRHSAADDWKTHSLVSCLRSYLPVSIGTLHSDSLANK